MASGPCVFCGTFGPLSKEDALPRWLARVVQDTTTSGDKNSKVERRLGKIRSDGSGHGMMAKWVPKGSMGIRKVRAVCHPCNNEWMSRLETSVQPILEPLVRGEARFISSAEREILAVWATKTTYMFDIAKEHLSSVPVEHFASFYLDRMPPPQMYLWLAKRVVDPLRYLSSIRVVYEGDPPPPGGEMTPGGQQFTLALGPLVLQVAIGYASSWWFQDPNSSAVKDRRLTVWPNDGRAIRWPPKTVLEIAEMDAFTSFTDYNRT